MADLSKKSPFRIILEQARDLGIKHIRFNVKVEDYTEDDVRRWEAWEGFLPDAQVFTGTNGQHALTELVAAKRYEIQQRERSRGGEGAKKEEHHGR